MLGAFDALQQYRLAAAVLHHGQGLGRGHYTAVCKVSPQQWIHWDDSSHRLITEAEALHMCVPPSPPPPPLYVMQSHASAAARGMPICSCFSSSDGAIVLQPLAHSPPQLRAR